MSLKTRMRSPYLHRSVCALDSPSQLVTRVKVFACIVGNSANQKEGSRVRLVTADVTL